MVQSYRKIRQPYLQTILEKKSYKKSLMEAPIVRMIQSDANATVKECQNKYGLGVVIKNSEGKYVATAMNH